MHVWERGVYYMHVINFLKNYHDVRPVQFTTTDSHILALIKRVFPSRLSRALRAHSTLYNRERWTHSKCFGEILQHIFYNESMTSVLYGFWQADDHQMCSDAWKQSGWASVWRQLSYNVAHTLAILVIHIAHLDYIKAILIACRPPTMSCSPAGCCYIGPPTATSNTLRNIQTDALPGPSMHMLTLGWGEEKQCRPLTHQWKYFSNYSTWHCLSEESDTYHTRELLFSSSTALKSRPAYYARVRIVCDILR